MKSMMVIAERQLNKHVGEEYDDVVEVADEPTTENIQPYANEVMSRIRNLWGQEVGVDDPSVVVHLDAATPFAAMLVNLRIIMKKQEGINIVLPWDKPVDVNGLDLETREVLEKLKNR